MPAAILNISLNDLPDLEILKGKESELNWEQRDRIISSLTQFFTEQRSQLDYSLAGMSTFSGSFADLRASFQALPANDARFVISGWIKNYYDDILLILHTPRTQLSIRTCNFISAFASLLGPGLFDSFAENTLNHLIKLCGTTKKIIATAASDVVKTIATLIVPQRAFPVLLSGTNDKNVNCRLRSFECLKIISERTYDDSSCSSVYQKIWENAAEKVLQKGIGDANAEIRSVALSIFLFFKDRTPDSVTKFMEKLDPSTKKQLSLLLSKSTPTSKQAKPIVSTVPLAQIRKAMLKDHSSSSNNDTPESKPPKSPVNRSTSTSPIKSAKSNHESLYNTPTISSKSKMSPSKSNYEISSSKNSINNSPTKVSSRLSPSKSASILSTPSKLFKPADPIEIPMDKISVNAPGSPMKIDQDHGESCDVFMDAQSGDDLMVFVNEVPAADVAAAAAAVVIEHEQSFIAESSFIASDDEEIILNVANAVKSSQPSTPRINEIENLTIELPHKIRLDLEKRFINNSPLKRQQPHSISSPSIPSRIKSLGLAAGTPLRTIYRNASEIELNSNNIFMPQHQNSSLLNDLIEEFCNTKDLGCFKKILTLTMMRTGDFDGLTCNLVHKLFVTSTGTVDSELSFKLLSNFLCNESFLLSSSGREVLEIVEERVRYHPETADQLRQKLSQSNLIPILIENCIEMCCERLSEFKLILLADFIKNFIGINLKEILVKSITPLLLALNHPNLNIRRLSMHCFLEARNKLDGRTDAILQLLNENSVGIIQKRIIEEFLRQF